MKKKLFTLMTLLLCLCSGAWGEKVSFVGGTASGQINVSSNGSQELSSTPVTINIVSPGAKSQDRQIWKDGNTAKNEYAFQLSSGAGNSYNTRYVEISVASGYKITGVTLRAANGSGTTAGTVYGYCFEGAFSTETGAVKAVGSFAVPGYGGTSDGANVAMTGIANNTRTVRIYKQVKYDSSTNTINGTNGSNYPSSAISANIASITVTYEAAAPTIPTLTGASSSPAASATNVAVSGSGYLKFNKSLSSVDEAKITITPSASGETLSSIAIDGTDASKVNYTWSGLKKETEYTINIAAGAVSDGTNTNEAATLSFTTVDKTALTAEWSNAAPSFNVGTIATIPTFTVTGGTLGTDYTVTYTKTDANGIVTLTNNNGPISEINTDAAATATVTATVTVINNAEYKMATTAYDCDITVAAAKIPVTLEFDQTSFVSLKSASFTKPTLTAEPTVSGISYSIEGPSGTSVNAESGDVTIGSTAGLATVTATFDGNTTYEAASASYTIAIGDAPVSTPKNWDFSTLDGTYEEYLLRAEAAKTGEKTWKHPSGKNDRFENAVALDKATLTANGFDLKITDGLKFTATASNLRLDKESSNKRMWLGSNAVITVPNCKKGQLITISMKNSGNSGSRSLTLTNMEGGDVENSKWTVGTTTTTFTGYVSDNDDVTMTVQTGLNIYTLTITDPVSGTITESGWNTFSSSYPLDLNTISGGTAYYASTTTGNFVKMTETTATVPAGEGLMIKGTPGEEFTIDVAASGSAISGNLLKGLPYGGTVAANAYNYVFAWPTATPADYGFYYVNATEPTLPAGKAYLHVDGGINARLNIVFDGETTGINTIENSQLTIDNDASMYNLAGQKVSKSYKGIVIVNGKKVVRK